MARIRTVKPELFIHDDLFDLERETQLPIIRCFIGLFCHADREGRFAWKPMRLKHGIAPYDLIDFSLVMDALWSRGFLVKYASHDGHEFGYIPSFKKHQVINNREQASALPSPENSLIIKRVSDGSGTRDTLVLDTAQGEGKGREGKGREGKGKEGKVVVTREEKPSTPDAPKQVITMFNQITGRNFMGSKSDLLLVKARLSDGFTVEDMRLVFESKNMEWRHDPKMSKYLAPETILRASNFEKYLQAARSAPSAEETPGDIIRSLLPDELKDTGIPL